LLLHLTNLGSAQEEPKPKSERDDEFRLSAEEATKQREKTARDEEDKDGRKRSKVLHGRE
jgi:hypothetical protein